jgi:hypothetical protein
MNDFRSPGELAREKAEAAGSPEDWQEFLESKSPEIKLSEWGHPSLPGQPQWTKEDLLWVARCQKNVLWMILVSILFLLVPYGSIFAGIVQCYFIYNLARAVRSSAPWVYIILAFIPIAGLIGLIHINGTATKTLQAHGIKVGLMGAKMPA